jgi:hypothetical protein
MDDDASSVIGNEDLAQSLTPPAQPLMPKPCYAARGNNPKVLRNIGVTAEVTGIGVGVFAAVNIVGFPEVEVIEGIGGVLGAISALGDFGLVTLNYGAYGAAAGGILGFAGTSPMCPGN